MYSVAGWTTTDESVVSSDRTAGEPSAGWAWLSPLADSVG